MNGLLSAMRREKAKIKKSLGTGKGVDEIYKSGWYAYNSMKFLWDKDTPCQTTSSIPEEKEMDIQETPVTEYIIESDVFVTHSPSSPLPPPPLISPSPSLSLPSTTLSSSKKRKKTEDARLEKAFELLTASATNSVNDESQDVGNFVAEKLRKYPAKTQSAIQNAILGIFLNADNGLYEQLAYTYNYPLTHPTCSTSSNTFQVSNLSSPYTTPTPESFQAPLTLIDNEELVVFSALN